MCRLCSVKRRSVQRSVCEERKREEGRMDEVVQLSPSLASRREEVVTRFHCRGKEVFQSESLTISSIEMRHLLPVKCRRDM